MIDQTKRRQGRPCIHGHSGERYKSSGACITCTKMRKQVRKLGVSFAEFLTTQRHPAGRAA